jgi:hypothetical protein
VVDQRATRRAQQHARDSAPASTADNKQLGVRAVFQQMVHGTIAGDHAMHPHVRVLLLPPG